MRRCGRKQLMSRGLRPTNLCLSLKSYAVLSTLLLAACAQQPGVPTSLSYNPILQTQNLTFDRALSAQTLRMIKTASSQQSLDYSQTIPQLIPQLIPQPIQAVPIQSQESLLTIQVNQGGTFSFIGHQHVVASRDLVGWIDDKSGTGYFSFEIEKMTMDEPKLLAQQGLPNPLKNAEKEATRLNMLKMLDVKKHPDARVFVSQIDRLQKTAQVHIRFNGQVVEKEIPIEVVRGQGQKIIGIRGQTNLQLTDFSIQPFSVFGGLLSVANEIQITLELKL